MLGADGSRGLVVRGCMHGLFEGRCGVAHHMAVHVFNGTKSITSMLFRCTAGGNPASMQSPPSSTRSNARRCIKQRNKSARPDSSSQSEKGMCSMYDTYVQTYSACMFRVQVSILQKKTTGVAGSASWRLTCLRHKHTPIAWCHWCQEPN